MDLIDKYQAILDRHRALQARLAEPEISSNPIAARPILKELKTVGPLVQTVELRNRLLQELEQARLLLEESDAALRELAAEEVRRITDDIQRVEDEIKILLVPKDEADERDAILEIRAGTGGEEAALFAADLFRMYSKFCEVKRWRMEVVSVSEADAGGFKEIIAEVHGNEVYGSLKWESGVHRVQRVPVTEAQGRIHTSAATVAVLPEAEEREIEIRPDDLKIQVYRASGHGGQHVNTTDSAVRITHVPTGIVVAIQDERSQIKNRARAMKILTSRLLAKIREEEASKTAEARRIQVGSGDRSEKIRTYNFPQNRVTDHRIDLTLYKLDRIMEGDLTEIVEALKLADRTERQKSELTADIK